MADCGEANSFASMDEETMDHDFATPPSKKSKYPESSVFDDQLPSTSISASSLLSECPESINSESDHQISDEELPSSPLPSQVPELMNEEKDSNNDDKQTFSANDDKQPDGPKHIINNVIYDYIPQDYTLTELDRSAHCAIEYSKEDDILVMIDDISIKKQYLMCLLDNRKWLDDEVIGAYICF